MDKINPQVLHFTERHMFDGNLCLTNTENYILGSISLNIIRGVELEFLLGKTFISVVLLFLSILMKNLMKSVLYN